MTRSSASTTCTITRSPGCEWSEHRSGSWCAISSLGDKTSFIIWRTIRARFATLEARQNRSTSPSEPRWLVAWRIGCPGSATVQGPSETDFSAPRFARAQSEKAASPSSARFVAESSECSSRDRNNRRSTRPTPGRSRGARQTGSTASLSKSCSRLGHHGPDRRLLAGLLLIWTDDQVVADPAGQAGIGSLTAQHRIEVEITV